jgi:hypothetical protein
MPGVRSEIQPSILRNIHERSALRLEAASSLRMAAIGTPHCQETPRAEVDCLRFTLEHELRRPRTNFLVSPCERLVERRRGRFDWQGMSSRRFVRDVFVALSPDGTSTSARPTEPMTTE